MSKLPVVKANTIINDYGINETGKRFEYEGKNCSVVFVGHSKYTLGIGEHNKEKRTFDIIAYIEFE